MVTTNQKPIIDTHKKKIKEFNTEHNTKDSHQITKKREEERNKKDKTTRKISQNDKSIYLSIITLNVNGLNAPIKNIE